MLFQVISHAGLRVACRGKELLTDPWIVGSCYWRSWWNYPPVSPELVASLKPDLIYLTHIHWDHFQSVSLRRFDRQTPIVIPRDRFDRMYRDLKTLGFGNIVRLRHGERLVIADDFAITSYHFSPYTDSALVIEGEGYTLLNANDAKFMGLPLKQIIDRHPGIHFVFRSHSSANNRVCHEYIDTPNAIVDDNERYLASFCHFVKKVDPVYAVPFASNHCHLHKEVFRFNSIIQTPHHVADYFERFRERHKIRTELKIMLSGDLWDSENGFSIKPDTYFVDRDRKLLEYQQSRASVLNAYYDREVQAFVTLKAMEQFFGPFFDALSWMARAAFRGKAIAFIARSDRRDSRFMLDVYAKSIREVGAEEAHACTMQMHLPALVLKRSLALKMFQHAGISKRVIYRATKADMPLLDRFDEFLSMYEYELIPLRRLFRWPVLAAYVRRWREVVLSVQLAFELLRGRKLVNVETKYLARYGADAPAPDRGPARSGKRS